MPRWLRGWTEEAKLGAAVGVISFLFLASAVFGIFAVTQLRSITQETHAISAQTQAIIKNGSSPTARAAETDRRLLCAVLKPALTSRQVTPTIRAEIRRDC